MSDLFRSQVIQLQTNRLHGDVLVLPRFSHSLILGFILLWVTAALWWLIASTYTTKETVYGWLEPPEGIARVYAEDSGTVTQVLVKEGEQVQAGQALVTINIERVLADGQLLDIRLLEEYRAQERLLGEQLERTRVIFQRREQDISQQIAAGERDLTLLATQLQTLEERIDLTRLQTDRESALREHGFIAPSDADRTANQALALHNELQGLHREQLSRRNSVNQLRTELELLPSQSANEISQLQARLSDVAQKVAQLAGQNSFIVRAPVAGTISNLQLRPGQHVSVARNVPLLTVMPDASQLLAHLLVPVRSAGFVEAGQVVNIRYDAFPYQKFGLYEGEIVSISDTVLLPDEVLNAPLRLEEPVYQITAQLLDSAIRAYGSEFPLKPGMTLSADIHLSERTLLQWLLEPIFTVRGRI